VCVCVCVYTVSVSYSTTAPTSAVAIATPWQWSLHSNDASVGSRRLGTASRLTGSAPRNDAGEVQGAYRHEDLEKLLFPGLEKSLIKFNPKGFGKVKEMC